MEYRIRKLNPAAWRIVRQKAGDRLDDGLRTLIEWWAAGTVDPFDAIKRINQPPDDAVQRIESAPSNPPESSARDRS